jgi:hypothetical protein
VAASVLVPSADNSPAVDEPSSIVELPPFGFARVDDVVTVLGGDEIAGGLCLEAAAVGSDLPSELVLVTSHTFTPNPDGGGAFGQGIGAVSAGSSATTAVPGLFQGSAQRTNVGALNTSGDEIQLMVFVNNSEGFEVGYQAWILQPYEQRQRPLPALGVTDLDGGTVVFELEGTGSYLGYTSTVDQASGDAVYNVAR